MPRHHRAWTSRAFIATSLDGFIARRDHDLRWLTDPPRLEGHARGQSCADVPDYEQHMAGVDHVVMGRGTYEVVRRFDGWPYPDHRVIVLSHTLHTGDDRITVASSTPEAVHLLNDRDSRGVYVDGGVVVQDWLRRDLLDEIVLTRAPVLLGAGIPLFGEATRDVRLLHQGSAWNAEGYVTSRYRVVHPDAPRRRRPARAPDASS
ncbi:dihydrofolate reductase family protein [Nigerium massiliense]|uniref:dihydrofolate reductase family protein n=1 Tax=Nigerium massiliense TaxID=1522317 RepID=UPI0006937D2B|nr:dihydrofolate reductase family protein [Nigerium massiliense]